MNVSKTLERVFLVKDAGRKHYNGSYVETSQAKFVHVDNDRLSIERKDNVWYLGTTNQGACFEGHYKTHRYTFWNHPPQHGWACIGHCCQAPVVLPAKEFLENQIFLWVQRNPNGRIEDLARNIAIDYRAFGFDCIHTFVQSMKRVHLQNNILSLAMSVTDKDLQPGAVNKNRTPIPNNLATMPLGALQNLQVRQLLNDHQILLTKYQYSSERHAFYKAMFIKCNDELIKSQRQGSDLQKQIEVLRKENEVLKHNLHLKEGVTQTQVRLQQRVLKMGEEIKALKSEIKQYSDCKKRNEQLEMKNVALIAEIGLLTEEKEWIGCEDRTKYKKMNERLEMKNLALMTEISLLNAEKKKIEDERARLEHKCNEAKNCYQQQLRVQNNDQLRESTMTLRVGLDHLHAQSFTLGQKRFSPPPPPVERERHALQEKSLSIVGNFHTPTLGRGRRVRPRGRMPNKSSDSDSGLCKTAIQSEQFLHMNIRTF